MDWFLSLASEQGIWAGGIAQEPANPGCRFGVAGMSQLQEGLSHPLGPAGIGRQHARKGLGEDATQTPDIVTEEFAGVNYQLDQYALGIVLYEMLSGATPFQGESMEALFIHHRELPMLALPGGIGVPAAVERVIRRATAKTADARFRSASDLADALEGALGRTPAVAGPTPPSIPPRRPAVGAGAGGGRALVGFQAGCCSVVWER